MSSFPRCLIVFAREPEIGRVKTRLTESLRQYDALYLYKAFIKDTLRVAESVNAEKKILAYDSSVNDPQYLKKVAKGFDLYRQDGFDLGEKMSNAFKFAQGIGCVRTIIIGADSPTLPYLYVDEAFIRLKESEIVLGPAKDGGYYLLGVRGSFDGLFNNIRWSSEDVFINTLRNANSINKKVGILSPWYDVDKPADIETLRDDLKYSNIAKFTKEALDSIG